MFEIKYPSFTYDTRTSEAYFRLLAENLYNLKLGYNNTRVITGYRDISGMTSGRYTCPSPSSYSLDATVNATSANIECDINPLFINSGYKLILSNSFGTPKIFIANMDHVNKTFGGITDDSNNNPFYVLNNTISDSAADRMYTFKFYSTTDTVYFSFINGYRFMVFTRLKPIDQTDGDKYLIIAGNQNGAIDAITELLFIDDRVPCANNCSYKATFTKTYSYSYNIFGKADSITLYNYVYDYKWYSEDIFTMHDFGFDGPTVLNGEYFLPIGSGLYLLIRG